MTNNNNSIKELSQEKNFETFLDGLSNLCKRVFENSFEYLELKEYNYNIEDTVKELELDAELIKGFLDDYIVEILKSKDLFLEYIHKLQQDKEDNKELDYLPLRELAHKNLGVARNLRIKSAEKLLSELMSSDDLEYIKKCLEALNACAITLNPHHAYKTLKHLAIRGSV